MKVDKYISKEGLKKLLKNPKFVAFAPISGRSGKVVGGELDGVFYHVSRFRKFKK